MSLETDVQELTQATTDLLVAVNVSKATLDGKVEDAGDFATASLNSANASAASAATATTQATAAGTARTGAETARDAAVVAQNNAVAVVTGGTATLTPSATKIPLSDAQGKIAKGWLTNTDLVEQTDIGTGPNEIPLNQFLGELAYLDTQNIPTLGINVANAATANVTNLMQVTEISNAVPSLNLDFAKVKQLDPRITFTRASTGTYYDGKTVAKAEENLFTFSEQFDNAAWAKNAVTVTANATTAPNSELTADKVFTNSSAGYHNIAVAALVTSSAYTLSVYVKAVEYSKFYIAEGGNGRIACDFDLVAVTAGTPIGAYTSKSATITAVGSGWYRCTVSFNTGVTEALSFNFGGYPNGATLNAFGAHYTGDGTSGIFVWGAQLEQRASATAYTPTTTQPVTNYIPVLQTAAAGVPRFEHNPVTGESLGLEIEEQRTNLLTYSEQFDNAAWKNAANFSSVTANATIAPDGTITADKLVELAVTNFHATNQSAAAGTYTFSFYAKAGERSFVGMAGALSVNDYALFNLSNGTVSLNGSGVTSAAITSAGNGWYRCSGVLTINSSGPYIYISSIGGTGYLPSYTGNGSSGIYIWGAQLEAGAFPTSYIPTVASQVTRAADSAVMTGANFSSWYRQAEGTFTIQYDPKVLGSYTAFAATDGSALSRIQHTPFAGGSYGFFVADNNVPQANISTGTAVIGAVNKFAAGYKVNDFAASLNGSATQTDTSGTVPVVSQLHIGALASVAEKINGTIRKITYYPQRLSNAELVEMTA